MTNMTVAFQTQYDGEGTTQFTSGMDDAKAQIEQVGQAGQTAGVNMEGLFRRMERPLSALVFSGVASDLENMSAKGMSATMKLEQGLHAIGMALAFINPLWGALFLAAGEVFNLYEKFTHVQTVDELDKETKSILDQVSKLKDLKDMVAKNGDAKKEELALLQMTTEASKEDIQKKLEAVNAQLKMNETINAGALAENTNVMTFLKGSHDVTDAQQKEIDLLEKKKILQDALTTATNGPTNDNTAVLQKRHDMMMQSIVDSHNLDETTKQLAHTDEFLDQTRKKILETTDPKALKSLEDQYDIITKLRQIEQQHLTDLKNSETQQVTILDNLKTAYTNAMGNIVQSLQNGGKSMDQITKDTLSTMVTDFGNAEAGMLLADAQKNAFINPGLSLLELAGAAAITAGTAALSSSIGGNSSATSTPPAAVGSASSNTSAASSSGAQTTQANLTININGGMIDKPTVAYILQQANELVQQNGYPLVATQINGVSPMPGSA